MADLETLRKKVQLYTKLEGYGYIFLFVSLWIVPIAASVITGGMFLLVLFYTIYGIAQVFICKTEKETRLTYEKQYKDVLVIPSLAKYFDKYTYRPEGTISSADIMGLNIWDKKFGEYDMKSEDLLTGTYKDVYYEQVDLGVSVRKSSREKPYSAFNGSVFKIRFNKRISGKLVLTTNPIFDPFSANGLSPIKTENEYFNNRFSIFSEDGHDAFYVLTPHFMECVLKLLDSMPRYRGLRPRMTMVFGGNTMTILRNNVRMFEVPVGKELDFFKEQEHIVKDMEQMLEIVDVLNRGKEMPEEKFSGNEMPAEEIQNSEDGPVAKFRLK